jgi:metallo-beta-lactamase class B
MRKIFAVAIFTHFVLTTLAQQSPPALEIHHLTGDFYIYKTFNEYKGSRIPANGMYVVTNEGVVMFDTPWDTTQFQPLLDSIKAKHQSEVTLAFATHFHEDRTAGLEYYQRKGIKTYTTKFTDQLSKETGKSRAEYLMDHDTTFTVGKYSFQIYYPGEGHTRDNIVIWFENEKVLYGGCLVKSSKDTTLGNLADANIKAYAETVNNVRKKCQQPKFVIPGHGDWSTTFSLEHTFNMAKELQAKKER